MEKLYRHFPDKLVRYLENYSSINDVTEIRMRADNIIQFTEKGIIKQAEKMFITKGELEDVFFSMCEYSQNAYEDEISNGFITLENGVRAGIGGEFYHSDTTDKYLLRDLRSLNIRIPSDNIYFYRQEQFFEKNPVSTLIIGPPHSGKTSLIKIYAEHLSHSNRICICDERREIYVKNLNCDVIKSIKKSVAISMATRTLNPQFILCDEISAKEAEEILSAVNTGVGFICSVHGKTLEEISRVRGINMLIENGVFKRFVQLSDDNKFTIKEITDV
ncbi:MAG: Flp pilus assembly complex ATPase component TadA [Oscillospiraceae bacterium]|nr:Flp pilus assembly complex ATPase component TadA [Oscillospiraceae bacterium]